MVREEGRLCRRERGRELGGQPLPRLTAVIAACSQDLVLGTLSVWVTVSPDLRQQLVEIEGGRRENEREQEDRDEGRREGRVGRGEEDGRGGEGEPKSQETEEECKFTISDLVI